MLKSSPMRDPPSISIPRRKTCRIGILHHVGMDLMIVLVEGVRQPRQPTVPEPRDLDEATWGEREDSYQKGNSFSYSEVTGFRRSETQQNAKAKCCVKVNRSNPLKQVRMGATQRTSAPSDNQTSNSQLKP